MQYLQHLAKYQRYVACGLTIGLVHESIEPIWSNHHHDVVAPWRDTGNPHVPERLIEVHPTTPVLLSASGTGFIYLD